NAARNDRDGVFKGDVRYWRIQQCADELKRFRLLLLLVLEPPRSGNGQVCTWRMKDRHVPSVLDNVENVTLNMEGRSVFRRQQVTRPCVVTPFPECLSDNPGELTANEDS